MFSTITTTSTPTALKSTVPQSVLYVPSILVALFLMIFLAVSFVLHHKRVIAKKAYLKEYARQNVNLKRERINGYITRSTMPQTTFPIAIEPSFENSVQSNDTCVISYIDSNSYPLEDLSHSNDDSTVIYLQKPKTPKSVFDSSEPTGTESRRNFEDNGRQSQTCDNCMPQNKDGGHNANDTTEYIDTNVQILSLDPLHGDTNSRGRVVSESQADRNLKVKIPMSLLCNGCKENLGVQTQYSWDESYLDNGEQNEAYLSDGEGHIMVQEETVLSVNDDAFHESGIRLEQKRKKKKSKHKRGNGNSRTFPEASVRMGVFEIK